MTETFASRLIMVARSAETYFELRHFEEEHSGYAVLAAEYGAMRRFLRDTLAEDGRFVDHDALLACRQALTRYRDELGEQWPYQRREVDVLLEELEHQEYAHPVPDFVR